MLDSDQPGSCGTTEFDEGDCSHGFSGAWDAAKLRLRSLDDCAQHGKKPAVNAQLCGLRHVSARRTVSSRNESMPYTARRARVFLWLLGLVASPGSAAIECPGILSKNGRACCPSFCNACGDKKCEEAPGGAELCCTENVVKGYDECAAGGTAPCKVPTRRRASPPPARCAHTPTLPCWRARRCRRRSRTAQRRATRGSTTTSSTRRAIPSARPRSRA